MNHQIEHNPHIRAPGRVGRQPVRLDKPRFRRHSLQVFENGIESLDMSHLQNAVVLTCQIHQFRCLLRVVGHRLLHQHMFAIQEQRFGNPMMRHGGSHDAESICHRRGLLERAKSFHMILSRVFLGSGGRNVVDSHEINNSRTGHLSINPHMLLAQRASPEDPDFQPLTSRCLSLYHIAILPNHPPY